MRRDCVVALAHLRLLASALDVCTVPMVLAPLMIKSGCAAPPVLFRVYTPDGSALGVPGSMSATFGSLV